MSLALFSGFKVLPVKLSDSTEHIIYIKKHESKDGTASGLFMVNVPVDSSLLHFKRLFRRCGVVESATFKCAQVESECVWMPRTTGSNCHLVFQEADSVEKVLCMKKRKRQWTDKIEDLSEQIEESLIPERVYGVAKWINMYKLQRPSIESFEKRVNKYMTAFETAESEKKLALLEQRNLPDEDGFVMVSRARGRRNTTKDGNGATVTAARPGEIEKLKPVKRELKDFYRFQLRESKRQDLADLRMQFEQDKKKIAALKSDRKFKPY